MNSDSEIKQIPGHCDNRNIGVRGEATPDKAGITVSNLVKEGETLLNTQGDHELTQGDKSNSDLEEANLPVDTQQGSHFAVREQNVEDFGDVEMTDVSEENGDCKGAEASTDVEMTDDSNVDNHSEDTLADKETLPDKVALAEKEVFTNRKASTEQVVDTEGSTEVDKEASTEKEELDEEASTEKDITDKEATTEKNITGKEASTEKEGLDKKASTEKEGLDEEASTEKEGLDEETSTEKEGLDEEAPTEKEALEDQEDIEKEGETIENSENQQTVPSSKSSEEESLDKKIKHLAEHPAQKLHSQHSEESCATDSLTVADHSEEKDGVPDSDDMGACVKKPKHEEESPTANADKKSIKTRSATKRSWCYGDRDTEQYRMGYPGKEDNPRRMKNLKFYMGEIKSVPDGDKIDKIHNEWEHHYELLESHHGYIQWIFPIREDGMNRHAQPLQLHEAEAIKSDPSAHARVLTSYKMMLGFYGMKLVDEKTGKIKRSPDYVERFKNLTWNTHNYLRITRILKSLGELGYEHLKKPFLDFILDEALNKNSSLRSTLSSCENYWIGTIKDDNAREELYQRIEEEKKKDYGDD